MTPPARDLNQTEILKLLSKVTRLALRAGIHPDEIQAQVADTLSVWQDMHYDSEERAVKAATTYTRTAEVHGDPTTAEPSGG